MTRFALFCISFFKFNRRMGKIAREAINLNYVNYAKELDNLLHSDTEQVNIVCCVFVDLNFTDKTISIVLRVYYGK